MEFIAGSRLLLSRSRLLLSRSRLLLDRDLRPLCAQTKCDRQSMNALKPRVERRRKLRRIFEIAQMATLGQNYTVCIR
jgi:hypothetical protein